MGRRINLAGKRFGTLLVIDYAYTKSTHAHWNVKCVLCNSTTAVSACNLKSGNSTGCFKCRNTNLVNTHIKHNKCNTTLYKRWGTLKHNKMLCDEWKDFEVFYNDVSSKYISGCSLRRIDRDKPHSKENSFWCHPRKRSNVLSERIYLD